jgi:hypothetical protein
MSGHLRAPLAAIAEIMLQCLSNNAPDLLTHLSLSLSLSLSSSDFYDPELSGNLDSPVCAAPADFCNSELPALDTRKSTGTN